MRRWCDRDSLDAAYEQFAAEKLDALAGLRPRLLSDVGKMPGAVILSGQFTAVQQAVGTARRMQRRRRGCGHSWKRRRRRGWWRGLSSSSR